MISKLLSVFFVFSITVTGVVADETSPELTNKVGSRLRGRTYTAISNAYSVAIPNLGAKNIQISDRETTPGITTLVKFVGDNKVVAAIVATKIRPDYPKDDSLLNRVRPRYANMGKTYGDSFSFVDTKDLENKSTNNRNRRYLQFMLQDESYTDFGFPFVISHEPNKETKSLGIHRLFVRNGYFYEVAMIIPAPGNVSAKDHVKNCEKQIGQLISKMNPK